MVVFTLTERALAHKSLARFTPRREAVCCFTSVMRTSRVNLRGRRSRVKLIPESPAKGADIAGVSRESQTAIPYTMTNLVKCRKL